MIIVDLVVDYQMKVGDHGKVSKEHVDKGVVVLFVFFIHRAHAIIGRVEAQD